MLDSQFSQNGTAGVAGGGVAAPGISVIVAPTGNTPTEVNKWVAGEEPHKEGKKIQLTDTMTTVDRVTLCAGEIVGTGILVFLGCMGCVGDIGGASSITQISLTFGLAVMIAVQCVGHISGSHINPIVTAAAFTLGNIPLIQVPIYFTGQMLGAIGGFGLLKLVTPSNLMGARYVNNSITGVSSYVPGVCSPGINPHLSVMQGLVVEFTISFVLVLVCCGVWDCRNNTKHDSVPIRFGLAIAALALAAAPYTGANMNPARSFAPALFNGDWDSHWVYWVGPLSAGFLGALFYRFLFGKENDVPVANNAAETIPLNDKA